MVLVLSSLGWRHVLAGAGEAFVARTYTHRICIVLVWSAALGMLGLWAFSAFSAIIIGFDPIFCLGILLSVPLFVFAALYWGDPLHEVILTNRNVYSVRWSFLGIRKLLEIPLESIAFIQIRQTDLGKTFNYGELILQLKVYPGRVRFRWIPNPAHFAQLINQQMVQRPELPPVTEQDLDVTLEALQKLYGRRIINSREMREKLEDLQRQAFEYNLSE